MYIKSLTDTAQIINIVPYDKMHGHQPPVQLFLNLEEIRPSSPALLVDSSMVARRAMGLGRTSPALLPRARLGDYMRRLWMSGCPQCGLEPMSVSSR